MQFCHRIAVQYRKCERIRYNDALVWDLAEYAIRLMRIHALSDYSEVLIISRAFVGVALKTKRLEVRQVSSPPCFRGTMWSTSMALSSAEMPQSSQRKPARFSTS
jgi:hypothetical protein